MKLSLIRFLVLIGLLTALSPLKAQQGEDKLANSFNQTGMILYHIMDKSSNTVISPFSINSILLMAYMGARGHTAQEMENTLHLTLPQHQVRDTYRNIRDRLGKGVQLGMSAWVGNDFSILPSYQSVVQEDFNGVIKMVDFTKPESTTSKMNEWINTHTEKKISDFIHPTDLASDTKMVLLNTLFIQGSWQSPFPISEISQFNISNGSTVPCKMMHQQSFLHYFENEETQAVVLPIKGLNSNTAFIVFLPKEQQDHPYDFYYAQDESKPQGFLSYLDQFEKKEVALTIPRFKVSQKTNLIPLLRSLGMHLPLDEDHADFSKITEYPPVYIENVQHESALSINEGGIFAAAVSSIKFAECLAIDIPEPTIPIIMNVDHPFFYTIYDFDTKLLLFLGECLNPTN